MQKACAEMYPATQTKQGLPRMTVIIVGKRHHTRFYPTTDQPNLTDIKSGNPKNGTVVDRGVTEARTWEYVTSCCNSVSITNMFLSWFCQAHQGLQGTARPAHYVVVHDELFRGRKLPVGMKNTSDVLEELTHNMCYMFGRATKAVSICPPAYYSDLGNRTRLT
jgi:eukaryotic translation initiation factor 2C